jgi:hypothetical protein
MPAPYRELLQRIRTAFPQPVSDRIHDSYLVHSIMRALHQVDALLSELPRLGGEDDLDRLVWVADEHVTCDSCGFSWDPNRGGPLRRCAAAHPICRGLAHPR